MLRQNNLWSLINTLEPIQNGRNFPDIFECIFLNENELIWIKISFSFVPNSPLNNIPLLVQIMACRRPGDKPLSEPVMANLLTHESLSPNGLSIMWGMSVFRVKITYFRLVIVQLA